MKKSNILKIVFRAVLLLICLNSTGQNSSKEINKFLAEGLECKELLHIRNKELRSADSTNAAKDSSIVQYKIIIKSDSTSKVAQAKEIGKLDKQLTDERKQTNKERKKKVFWRTLDIGLAGALLLVLLL